MDPVLLSELQALLGDARLRATRLPGLDLQLWLLDPTDMNRAFDTDETRRILEDPPYWCFCWASGLALARWLLENPRRVAGKRVLDVGAGSGVAAIAAAQAGAREVVACDLDPLALRACRANAALNNVQLAESADLFTLERPFDLILAADVLYDRLNWPLLDELARRGREVLVADSRVRDFRHPGYRVAAHLTGVTLPDLLEPEAFRQVTLYQACFKALSAL